jgi:hypothetical protein
MGDQPVEPLRVLADVLEPLKFYERPQQRNYSTDTPLDGLVDAVRPESLTAWGFKMSAEAYLKDAPRLGDGKSLRTWLNLWTANHKILEPLLEKAGMFSAANQSRDLASISKLGLEAMNYLDSGKQAPVSWREKAAKALVRSQIPQAEMEIAVIQPIRKLTLAAGQWKKLKELKPGEWIQSLDAQLKAAKRRSWE